MKEHHIVKSFQKLTNEELYSMLRLRSEIFVVEQNCTYLDLDNKDQRSFHLLIYLDGYLAGYSRILPAGISYKEVSIGRVATAPSYRGTGIGKKLVEASIAFCRKEFDNPSIRIGAQLYLLKFYKSLGFIEGGAPYDEDGIMHIQMVKMIDKS